MITIIINSIIKFLQENNVTFVEQKTFDNCKYKQKLQFDFFLPDYNMCIEFDGIQHFKPIEAWGGKSELTNIQKKDKIKTNYCQDNKIKLLRIKYNEKVDKKLIEYLFPHMPR